MKIAAHKEHLSGIPLGGIGTGSVELRPDGEFHAWQIYNTPRWAECAREAEVDDGEGYTGSLSFWIRTEDQGRVLLRKLSLRTPDDEFTYRMYSACKPVESIEFEGRFPVCELAYIDDDLPVSVRLRAIAPFVPHDAPLSGTPGFYLDFTVENRTDRPIRADLLCRCEAEFLGGVDRINRGIRADDTLSLSAESGKNGVCLSVSGGSERHLVTADYKRYLREYVSYSEFGVVQESLLFDFLERGAIPDSDAGIPPKRSGSPLEELSDERLTELCDEIAVYPFAASIRERVRKLNPTFPADREEKIAYLNACYGQIERLERRDAIPFGSGALSATVNLPPKGRDEVNFVYSWYFPDHIGIDGRYLGHFYGDRFKDAADVNRFLRENRAKIADRAVEFADLLFDTTMPAVYPDCWSSHLATLVKCSWWLADGKFGIWEGLGFCGFHTTDITYHASFGLLALFPELQKGQMEMGAAFQRADGRVHHFFTPDLYHVDDGYHRVDMNMQFVLMVARDYLWTGDFGYLSRMWGPVCKAMDSTQALDGNGDGLPDRETRRNTYDAWNFSGTPTYIAILWLSALTAAIRLAVRMEDTDRREKWEKIREIGLSSLENKLWNGEYYDLWMDETRRDGSLMSDQLDGEFFLRAAGIGSNLPDERIRTVIRAILAHNYDPERGLINASCPDGHPTTLATYKNCQAEARWTGIGYAFAALCLSVGFADEAEDLVRNIHESQARYGLFWDHWECGHHYSRPMSSFATLDTALGLSIDREAGTMRLSPVTQDPLILPLIRLDGIGQYRRDGNAVTIDCRSGCLHLRRLELCGIAAKSARVIGADGGEIPTKLTVTAAGTVLEWDAVREIVRIEVK